MTSIGTRLPRHEDPRLLRGRGRFGDDVNVTGQLWARIVRSPSAHGLLRELDVTQATARRHGRGEGGINAAGATVANAVRDALGLTGSVGQLPLTPARVCALAPAAGGPATGDPATGDPATGDRA